MRLCLLTLLLCTGAVARAQTPADLEAAKIHFKAGESLYEVGAYGDAIHEWIAGYGLAPRPLFLLNLGQAHRKMKNWPKAAEFFARYLATVPPDDPRRGEVQDLLAEMNRAIAGPTPQWAQPPPPATTPSTEAAAAIAPVPATSRAAAPPPSRTKELVRKNWWIAPAGAVVIGVALGVGIYYGTHPANGFNCGGTISCIDATRAQP